MGDGDELNSFAGRRVVFSATQAFRDLEFSDDTPTERMGREQSNTSVIIGDQAILKAFRRLQYGVHPEIEIGRLLTDVAHYKNAPHLLGSVELIDADGEPTALAVLQGYLRNQGDGWAFTQDYLHRILHEREIVPADKDASAEGNHQLYVGLARTLESRVAELHQAFALDVDDPAFRPEPVTAEDMASWTERVRQQATIAQDPLKRAVGSTSLSAESRNDISGLLGRWSQIEALVQRAPPKRWEVNNTRYHGDLHLGQVVVVRDDFYILDFEGEPIRSMDGRRAKHSPLRDVAGMIRSFNYAALTSLFDHQSARPGAVEELQAAINTWETLAVQIFLSGYHDSIQGCPSVPKDPRAFRRLLKLFILEKALYEICYEGSNRPDWLNISVRGVQQLLSSNP